MKKVNTLKTILGALFTCVAAAVCVGGLYLKGKGIDKAGDIKNYVQDKIDDSVGNDGGADDTDSDSQFIKGKNESYGWENEEFPIELDYEIKPTREYDADNKTNNYEVYGSTFQEKDYYNERSPEHFGYLESLPIEYRYGEYMYDKKREIGIGDRVGLTRHKTYLTLDGVELYDDMQEFWGELKDSLDIYKYQYMKEGKYVNLDNGSFTKDGVNLKFLVVTMTWDCYSQWVTNLWANSYDLYYLEDMGDYYKWNEEWAFDDEYNHSGGSPIFFDKEIDNSCWHFVYPMCFGEKLTFKLGWIVDADKLDDVYIVHTAYSNPAGTYADPDQVIINIKDNLEKEDNKE